MRILITLVALCALLALPAGAAEMLFGVTGAGSLITLNTETGAGTHFMNTYLGSWEALDAHPSGMLYGIVNEHRLATINVHTGDIVVVGDLVNGNCGEALAWVEGTLYGSVDLDGGCRAETLATIDPATGYATPVGPFGSGYVDVDGFAYRGGTLYATDMNVDPNYRALLTVNTSTGHATPVAEIQQRVIALAFDSGGVLYGATIPTGMGGPSNLVRIDHISGDVTELGPTGYTNLTGLAFLDVTIPVEEMSWSAVKASYR